MPGVSRGPAHICSKLYVRPTILFLPCRMKTLELTLSNTFHLNTTRLTAAPTQRTADCYEFFFSLMLTMQICARSRSFFPLSLGNTREAREARNVERKVPKNSFLSLGWLGAMRREEEAQEVYTQHAYVDKKVRYASFTIVSLCR